VSSFLDTIGGLTVHVLIVHAVVILVPLAAIGAMIMVFWPAFSRRFGPLVVIVAGVAAVCALIARQSGLEFARRVGTPQPHEEIAQWMAWIAFGFFLFVLVYWLFDRGVPLNKGRPRWLSFLGFLLILASLFAIWWTYRAGDTGSRAVWEETVQNTVRR
jgi:hypothetical protein